MKYYKHNDFQPETDFKHTLLNTYETKTKKTYTENPKGIRLNSVKFRTDIEPLCTEARSSFPPCQPPSERGFTYRPAFGTSLISQQQSVRVPS